MSNYSYNPLCKVCNARNWDGKPLREEVDAMIAQGKRNVDCIRYLLENGVSTTQRNFSRHLTNHSSFAREAKMLQSSTAVKLKRQFEGEQVEGKKIIQKVLGKADQMIDNWWNGREGEPQLPITGEMVINALKEEGRKAPRTEIDSQIEELTRQAIEG